MYTFALLFLCIITFAKTEDSKSTNGSTERSQEQRLMKYLRTLPDTPPKDTIHIDAYFFLQFFTFGHDETTIKAYGNILLSWTDERLSWNSSDYGGLSEIVYQSYYLWEPHLSLLNRVDYDDYEYHYGLCNLYQSGLVGCLPKIVHESTCNTFVSNWPYDVQNCTIQIGIFAGTATVNISEDYNRVTFLIGSEYSTFWSVLKVYYKYSQIDRQFERWDKGSQIDITFLLKREGAGLGAAVVFPMISLTVLTLCSFLLTARNMRLGILCFSLLCHFMFLSGISDLIPKYSFDCPTILYYLRGSVMISMLLVILTMLISFLLNRTTPMQTRLSDLIEYVLESRIRFFILRLNSKSKRMTTKEMVITSEWADFSDLVNSLCFWLAILVYVCFMCLYLPREARVEPDKLDTFHY